VTCWLTHRVGVGSPWRTMKSLRQFCFRFFLVFGLTAIHLDSRANSTDRAEVHELNRLLSNVSETSDPWDFDQYQKLVKYIDWLNLGFVRDRVLLVLKKGILDGDSAVQLNVVVAIFELYSKLGGVETHVLSSYFHSKLGSGPDHFIEGVKHYSSSIDYILKPLVYWKGELGSFSDQFATIVTHVRNQSARNFLIFLADLTEMNPRVMKKLIQSSKVRDAINDRHQELYLTFGPGAQKKLKDANLTKARNIFAALDRFWKALEKHTDFFHFNEDIRLSDLDGAFPSKLAPPSDHGAYPPKLAPSRLPQPQGLPEPALLDHPKTSKPKLEQFYTLYDQINFIYPALGSDEAVLKELDRATQDAFNETFANPDMAQVLRGQLSPEKIEGCLLALRKTVQ
jgi:hypothetical protein